jgi:predicted acyl esterase
VQVEAVINQHKDEINLDSENLSDLDRPLNKICDILGLRPKSVHHTRNHLRREAAGFKVLRDFQIASPDGGYVLADVYLPLQPKGRFPVLLSCTLYGRRIPWGGPDLNDDRDILAFELAEDEWRSTEAGTELHLPDRGPWSEYFRTQRGFENIATFNTFSYVPKGYAMVKMDPVTSMLFANGVRVNHGAMETSPSLAALMEPTHSGPWQALSQKG